jgi:hypothetical protein
MFLENADRGERWNAHIFAARQDFSDFDDRSDRAKTGLYKTIGTILISGFMSEGGSSRVASRISGRFFDALHFACWARWKFAYSCVDQCDFQICAYRDE